VLEDLICEVVTVLMLIISMSCKQLLQLVACLKLLQCNLNLMATLNTVCSICPSWVSYEPACDLNSAKPIEPHPQSQPLPCAAACSTCQKASCVQMMFCIVCQCYYIVLVLTSKSLLSIVCMSA